MLEQLRAMDGLKEKSRGAFYRAGRAVLHFHEDGEELSADLRRSGDFERVLSTSAADRAALLRKIKAALKARP